MLSPKLKQQVSSLWDMFWSGGMTNPLTSIEQITYLIFLKRLEVLDSERQAMGKPSLYGRRPNCELEHHPLDKVGIDQNLPDGADAELYKKCEGHGTCRWRYLKELSEMTDSETKRDITPYEHMNRYVFPWLRVLHHTLRSVNHNGNGIHIETAPMEDAFFQFPKDKTAIFQNAIAAVEDLFKGLGHTGSDLMGDIFEELLSEIQTSGKNGQFRTPRHIIRFLIELIEADKGHYVLDPAAATAGFLINDIQYLKKRYTPEETVVYEWDGTPHRTFGSELLEEEWNEFTQGQYFVGYDNDRTMVRIGWMNMVLHGIENPHITLRDTLGKSLGEEESNKYDRILTNPPYTGTIDKNDLNLARFPRNPNKSNEPITNKTELLFSWLVLDLLRPGGKAAVIVPEGVLFGSTRAHKELRRQLLFEHNLLGVISLPAGIFQPYTGVKTSVLIFQKGGELTAKGKPPRTQEVWFYEVSSDGYGLGARREPDYKRNDLWDALYKWQQPEKIVNSTDYYQPKIYNARWRLLDEKLQRLFPGLFRTGWTIGQEYGIHELFGFADPDPKGIEEQISNEQGPEISELYRQRVYATEARLIEDNNNRKNLRDVFEQDLRTLDRIFSETMNEMLENTREWKANSTFGLDTIRPLLEEARKEARELVKERVEYMATHRGLFALEVPQVAARDWQASDWQVRVEAVVREFVKLDGYNVKLRTAEVCKQDELLAETKSWSAPVRVLAQRDWIAPDGTVQSSHDAEGDVRPEYLADAALYENEQENIIKKEYLDANCIEFNDYNLSAGRYKPFNPVQVEYEPPAKLIRELQEVESEIMRRLDNLLRMVEGK